MSSTKDNISTRSYVCDKLVEFFKTYQEQNKEIYHKDRLPIAKLVCEIENAIFFESVKVLIQNSDAIWKPIYLGFFSNVLFNLNNYINRDILVSKLILNPHQEMLRIILNGPLAMNETLPEIAELLQHEQEATRVTRSSNTGGLVACPKCGKKEVYRQLVQDRGGDEAFSSYLNCLNPDCLHTWRRGGG